MVTSQLVNDFALKEIKRNFQHKPQVIEIVSILEKEGVKPLELMLDKELIEDIATLVESGFDSSVVSKKQEKKEKTEKYSISGEE